VSDIKKAAVEMQKAYETASKGSEAAPSAGTAFSEGFSKASEKVKEAEQEDRIESFISRRSEDSPSTYAPERPSEKAERTGNTNLTDAPERVNPGYGDITQKQIEEVIAQEATLRNIDPKVAIAIFRSEGAGNYQSQIPRSGKGVHNGKEASFGPYQLFTGGGLGNEYEKNTGRNLLEDNTMDGITNQIRFSLDAAVDQGWTPWYGRKHAGVGTRDGLSGAKKLGNWK
jgi:hypothetical protein